MHRLAIKLVLAVAVIATSGAQWSVLQSVAWMSMTLKFAQDMSLSRAVEKTFSGDFPCTICLLAKKAGEEGSKGSVVSKSQKQDWNAFVPYSLLYPPQCGFPKTSEVQYRSFRSSPPVPPPELLHS